LGAMPLQQEVQKQEKINANMNTKIWKGEEDKCKEYKKNERRNPGARRQVARGR
jgi:hypothetical protein